MLTKILIISYYLPPYTGIQGHRANSFLQNFASNGYFPILVTRHWNTMANNWEDHFAEDNTPQKIVENTNGKVYYLPYKSQGVVGKGFITTKFQYWKNKFFGSLQVETDTLQYEKIVNEIIKKEDVKAILISTPPLNSIQVGYKVAKKNRLPLFIDFRDLHEKKLTKKQPDYTLAERFNKFIVEKRIAVAVQYASLTFSVSPPLSNKLTQIFQLQKKSFTIYNGFEKNIFTNTPIKNLNVFTINMVGTLYPQQDIQLMCKGFNLFSNKINSNNYIINFIGVRSQPIVADIILNELKGKNINVTDKVTRDIALEYTKNAHILFYIGWPEYNGIISGKIFEYIASGNRILIAPNDHGVINDLVAITNTGECTDSAEEMANSLLQSYNEWKTKGYLQNNGNVEEINKYTRENQSKILCNKIDEVLI